MDPRDQELAELRRQVEDLQRRMERLEASTSPVVPPRPPVAEPVFTPQIPVPPVQPPPPPQVPPPIPPPIFASQPAPAQPRQSLETRIGTHWLNRVGIVAVLVGVSYFLKYAFDNGWIGPSGRIAIGLLAGIAITVWSETFRRKGYALFSYGLKAIGIGTLYLSLWAAVQMYHLISPGVGFGAMLIVTAATVVMALTQNAQLLGAYALAGGFSTPALCSTGGNHEIFLFSYTAILAAGAVTLTAMRGWRRLASGAFVGTLVMYVAWYAEYYQSNEFAPTVFFATLFFLIFAGAALVPRRGEPGDSTILAAIFSIFNAAVYFIEMYLMFDTGQSDNFRDNAAAILAILLAGFFVFLSRQIAAQESGSENRRALNLIHLALAVGFITAAIPLKLSGHWITIGWLVESAALLYVAQRIRHNFLKIFAGVALVLGIGRLFVDFWRRETVLLFNPRFATFLVAIAVLAMVIYGVRNSQDERERNVGRLASIALNLLALVALYHEVEDFFYVEANRFGGYVNGNMAAYSTALRNAQTAEAFTLSAIWMLYGAALMFIGFRFRSAFLRWQAIVLLGITILKVFLFDTSALQMGFRILSFIGLGIVLLGISFLYQRGHISLPGRDE